MTIDEIEQQDGLVQANDGAYWVWVWPDRDANPKSDPQLWVLVSEGNLHEDKTIPYVAVKTFNEAVEIMTPYGYAEMHGKRCAHAFAKWHTFAEWHSRERGSDAQASGAIAVLLSPLLQKARSQLAAALE